MSQARNRPQIRVAPSWAGLGLSLGALGVVYGDIGTSPLYTVQLIFTTQSLAPTTSHVYGAISLIFWSLVLIVTLKYVLLILRADNQGEGGIMALVALVERSVTGGRRKVLVTIGILGASLFYGDGMLTPATSVVSAPTLCGSVRANRALSRLLTHCQSGHATAARRQAGDLSQSAVREPRECHLRVVAPPDASLVRRLLELTGLVERIPVFETRTDAESEIAG